MYACCFDSICMALICFYIKKVISTRSSSSQTISNDAVLQDLASRDLPAIPSESSEDEDDSNGQLQKRNLFQSLQHNPSHVFPTNASSLSIKSGTSSLGQSDSKNNLNTKKKKPRNFISSNFSSTYSNHSEFSQQDPFVAKPLPPEPKRDEFVKASSTLLRRKNAMKLRGTRHDTTNDSGMPVTRPNLKSSVDDFSSVASSFKTANVSDSVGESEMEHTSLSHRGYDVPMIQPSVIQTSHSSMFLNDDNLDDQKNTSESSICSDTTLVTQHPPLTSKILQEEVVRELNVPGAFPSDKPSTSPNLHNPPLNSTTTDSILISPKDNSPMVELEVRRKPNMNSFVLNLVTSQVVSTLVLEKVQPPKTLQWKRPLQSLQRISDVMVWRMEGLPARRMESRNLMVQSKTSPETLSSRTAATPETEEPLRPQLQTLREDNSSKEAHIERQQALQTQLDKALAELREVQVENNRLTIENQSQQRSISHLKIALDEAKHEQQQNNNSLNNQLRDTTSSLDLLNEEKKGWQDKLDSMQHKLNAAERQVRCLDHLTRRKFELRREASQSQPKRRALLSASSSIIPASTVVVDAMRVLNEEIYQTCVQFVEGLERTDVSSTKQTPQVHKVLGDHLTAMMEDHAKKVTSGYNMLLMQTVLEVFMTHWCSSIIEAFYPHQESFTDLLAELSAQTTTNSSGKNYSKNHFFFFGAGFCSLLIILFFFFLFIYRSECHLREAS